MASYKVPQDVEADDKLIGPFSFRQFIYIIVACLAGGAAWFLSQIFIGLIIIPLPVILLFGALALPLRKDQPMEIYLVAMVRFFLKPRIRLWQPEGQVNLV
ncbi:MAG: PrgI family protein, partial [Candidatus Saccharimonadales bacterium]